MDPQKIFDSFLLKKDKEGAFEWVMEKLAWDPESSDLLGMGAFAFFLLNDSQMASCLALDALRKDPDNLWALAAVFGTTYRLEEVLSRFHFHTDKGFALGYTWIARFYVFGKHEELRQLVYCLSRYGSPLQKAKLSEDWLVNDRVPTAFKEQLELDLPETVKTQHGKNK
jgi:hypothetical protein